MRRTPVDTGDNPKKGYEVLINKAKQLEISRGCRAPTKDGDIFKDSTRQRFAYRMRGQSGFIFYFVARSDPPYGKDHLVSSQKWFVARALAEQVPIVMYWPGKILKFSCTYNIFDPELILLAARPEDENMRFGEVMLNWMASLGTCWPKNESIEEAALECKKNSLRWREWTVNNQNLVEQEMEGLLTYFSEEAK